MAKFSGTFEFPYICPLTNRKFEQVKGLSCYLTKNFKYNHKEYYDKYNKNKLNCFFCKNEGKFISLAKGYTNLCNSKECISKSRATLSIDGVMYNHGVSEDEAKMILLEKKIKIKNTCINTSKIRSEENPDYLHENSSWHIKFWLKKGYSQEEAEIKLKEHHNKNGNALKNKLLRDDIFKEEFKNKCTTSLRYWIDQGFSKEKAKDKLKERQNTFSLEKCIEKYGEEEGLKRFNKRQEKWQNTLNSKSDEEKLEINKKKMFNNSGFSNISQELFNEIYKEFKDNDIFYHTLNNEIILYDKLYNNIYRYDYVDFTTRKVIEFNGDFWHCNPLTYNENYFHTFNKKLAKDIWEYDKIKNDFIIKKGYDVLVVWESEFKQNRKATIEKCIEFINTKNLIYDTRKNNV